MIVQTFASYLKHLTAEVRRHGREAIKDAEDPRAHLVGFKSPTGIWQIGLGVLKEEFSKGRPWRENTSMMETYKKLGGKTPIQVMTRVPPPDEFAKLYSFLVKKAIAEGERLRGMH